MVRNRQLSMAPSILLLFLYLLQCSLFVVGDDLLRKELSHNGYRLEEHLVITDDSYVLHLERAIPKRTFKHDHPPSPVIVFHGIFTDSSIFFLGKSTDVKKCATNLGSCLLGDDGEGNGMLDVWFANARGNGRSNQHLNYTTHDHDYWKFSLEEIALYDLRSIVDFVLHETGSESVGFVGYSQGASAMFALLSTIPTYRPKIRPFIAWAPTVYTHSSPTILKRILAPFQNSLLGESGQFPLSRTLSQWLGSAYGPTGSVIDYFIRLVFGPSHSKDSSKLYQFLGLHPGTVSNWQVAHFMQLWNSPDHRFRALDHFWKKGRMFDLRKIAWDECPIVIMYGSNDWFVSAHDVEQLIRELRDRGHRVLAEKFYNFNHVDFIFDTNDVLNKKTRELLLKFMS